MIFGNRDMTFHFYPSRVAEKALQRMMITSVAVEKLFRRLLALKARRARMPYKRFSPPRDTFLVTQLRQFLPLEGLFLQPRPLSFTTSWQAARGFWRARSELATMARVVPLLPRSRLLDLVVINLVWT